MLSRVCICVYCIPVCLILCAYRHFVCICVYVVFFSNNVTFVASINNNTPIHYIPSSNKSLSLLCLLNAFFGFFSLKSFYFVFSLTRICTHNCNFSESIGRRQEKHARHFFFKFARSVRECVKKSVFY